MTTRRRFIRSKQATVTSVKPINRDKMWKIRNRSHRSDQRLKINEKLMREAEELGVSRNHIATHIGEPPRTIYRLLSEDCRVSGIENLERVARALGLEIVLRPRTA